MNINTLSYHYDWKNDWKMMLTKLYSLLLATHK